MDSFWIIILAALSGIIGLRHLYLCRKQYAVSLDEKTAARGRDGGGGEGTHEYKAFRTDPVPNSFDLTAEKEAMYRPFRWSSYQVTMGLRTIATHDWLSLFASYPSYVRIREARHELYGSSSYQIVGGPSFKRHEAASLEAARAIASYLAQKYPQFFVTVPEGSHLLPDDGAQITGVRRLAHPQLGLPAKEWKLYEEELGGDNAWRVAGELVPDDLALLLPDLEGEAEGQYRFIGGSICAAGFWRLDEKIGLTLRQIHLTGKVAQYEERLMGPMDRWFTKLKPATLAERNNYFFQVFSPEVTDPLALLDEFHRGTLHPTKVGAEDAAALSLRGKRGQGALHDPVELSWSHSSNGPEALFDHTVKRSVVKPEDGFHYERQVPPAATRPEEVAMRSERQTLRKLPKSGAVLFTIRTHLTPIPTMAKEPGVPGRLASAMRSWPEDVQWYKGVRRFRDVCLPYLDAAHEEQVASGIFTGSAEEILAAKRAYPF